MKAYYLILFLFFIPIVYSTGNTTIVQTGLTCSGKIDCEEFGDKYYCIQGFCLFQETEPVCNYDGRCSPSDGENIFSCGSEYINDTLVKEGDCILEDMRRVNDGDTQIFLWLILIIFIGCLVWLSWSDKDSFVRQAYRKYKERYFEDEKKE